MHYCLPAKKICQKYLTRDCVDPVFDITSFPLLDCQSVQSNDFELLSGLSIKVFFKWRSEHHHSQTLVEPFYLFRFEIKKKNEFFGKRWVVLDAIEERIGNGFDKRNRLACKNQFVFLGLRKREGFSDLSKKRFAVIFILRASKLACRNRVLLHYYQCLLICLILEYLFLKIFMESV